MSDLPTLRRLPADFVDRLRDLLSTVRTAEALLATQSDRERLQRAVRLAVKQTGAAGGLLYVIDTDRGDLEIAAAVGASYQALVGGHVGRTGLPGYAIDDAQPMAVADPGGATPAAASSTDEIAQRTGVAAKSQLVAPILVFGVAAGALELRDAPNPRGFTPADVEITVELAHVAAAAVEAHRGERLLASMFAAVLPRALDPDRPAGSLVAELGAWLDELQGTGGFRRELALAHKLRALAGDEAGLEFVEGIVDAALRREQRRGGGTGA